MVKFPKLLESILSHGFVYLIEISVMLYFFKRQRVKTILFIFYSHWWWKMLLNVFNYIVFFSLKNSWGFTLAFTLALLSFSLILCPFKTIGKHDFPKIPFLYYLLIGMHSQQKYWSCFHCFLHRLEFKVFLHRLVATQG